MLRDLGDGEVVAEAPLGSRRDREMAEPLMDRVRKAFGRREPGRPSPVQMARRQGSRAARFSQEENESRNLQEGQAVSALDGHSRQSDNVQWSSSTTLTMTPPPPPRTRCRRTNCTSRRCRASRSGSARAEHDQRPDIHSPFIVRGGACGTVPSSCATLGRPAWAGAPRRSRRPPSPPGPAPGARRWRRVVVV